MTKITCIYDVAKFVLSHSTQRTLYVKSGSNVSEVWGLSDLSSGFLPIHYVITDTISETNFLTDFPNGKLVTSVADEVISVSGTVGITGCIS